jgi:hypothetical protein
MSIFESDLLLTAWDHVYYYTARSSVLSCLQAGMRAAKEIVEISTNTEKAASLSATV